VHILTDVKTLFYEIVEFPKRDVSSINLMMMFNEMLNCANVQLTKKLNMTSVFCCAALSVMNKL
jgi:hypothetical protein